MKDEIQVNRNAKQKDRVQIVLLCLAGVSAFIGCVLWIGIQLICPQYEISKLGTVGDFFGGTSGPLLAFASFVLLIATYRLQCKDLQLTREELSLTREELAATAREFNEQNNTLRIQRFENTFFQMLSLHNSIVDNIVCDDLDHYKGRKAFYSFYNHLKNKYFGMGKQTTEEMELKILANSYTEFFNVHQATIGHYFRNMYHILKFIDETPLIETADKLRYVAILRAQLSTYELLLLFYNALSPFGSERFKPLIDKYKLIDDNLNGQLY